MKAKWCFIALSVVLTFFGVNQEENVLPNQEVVVQFSSTSIDSNQAKRAITFVKEQLQKIGVTNIRVKEEAGRSLKITYFSDTDVASIKEVLSQGNSIVLDYTPKNQDKHPSDKKSNSYNLSIYEIIDNSNSDWDFDGIHISELKSESVRFFNPKLYLASQEVDEVTPLEKTALRVHKNIAIAIDNTSHIIPEVRAGPAANKNS